MTKPAHPLRLLAVTLGAAVLIPAVFLFLGLNVTMRDFYMAFVYSNCIGLPTTLLLPRLARAYDGSKWMIPAVGLGIVVMTTLGCVLAGLILVLVGISPAREYWTQLFVVVRLSVLMALVFGMSAFFYEYLKGELEDARRKLHEKELEEERARKLAVEARLSSLESRIHPHFLFNTLNSISSLIPSNPQRAEETVGRLSALLRASLDHSRRPLVPLRDELRIVRDYLEIETARFGDRLKYSVELGPGADLAAVPPLSVQSLVENAVKHGLAKHKGTGRVSVEAQLKGTNLDVQVRDSGPGFSLSDVPSGHGLENLTERLDTLFGAEAGLSVRHEGGDCVVAMVVPQTARAAIA